MSKTFRLQILSPEGLQLDVETDSVCLPALDGALGVMGGHAPMLAALRDGEVRYRQDGQWKSVPISGGTGEVTGQTLVILLHPGQYPA